MDELSRTVSDLAPVIAGNAAIAAIALGAYTLLDYNVAHKTLRRIEREDGKLPAIAYAVHISEKTGRSRIQRTFNYGKRKAAEKYLLL